MDTPGSDGEHQLQKEYGSNRKALAFYKNQMLDYLNPPMCSFISNQEMVFVATSDAKGECDCSFRTGPAGFVRVLGNKWIIYPEYRGNGVLGSLGNISENPHIGLIFIDFFQDAIGLHVNGKARIIENKALLKDNVFPDLLIQEFKAEMERKAERWVSIEVEEAYIHCSKHIPLLKKLDKKIQWGTDSEKLKGGDYFQAKSSPRPAK